MLISCCSLLSWVLSDSWSLLAELPDRVAVALPDQLQRLVQGHPSGRVRAAGVDRAVDAAARAQGPIVVGVAELGRLVDRLPGVLALGLVVDLVAATLAHRSSSSRFVVGWSELQSRVLREVDAVPGVDLRGVLAGELVLGVAERLGDLDDVLAVVALDLDVRRDHRPLIDLDLGAVEQEARPPVLLIRLRSIAEQPEQPVGLLEI